MDGCKWYAKPTAINHAETATIMGFTCHRQRFINETPRSHDPSLQAARAGVPQHMHQATSMWNQAQKPRFRAKVATESKPFGPRSALQSLQGSLGSAL